MHCSPLDLPAGTEAAGQRGLTQRWRQQQGRAQQTQQQQLLTHTLTLLLHQLQDLQVAVAAATAAAVTVAAAQAVRPGLKPQAMPCQLLLILRQQATNHSHALQTLLVP